MWPELQLYIVFLLGVGTGMGAFALYVHRKLKSWKVVKHILVDRFPIEAPANATAVILVVAASFACLGAVAAAYKSVKALRK